MTHPETFTLRITRARKGTYASAVVNTAWGSSCDITIAVATETKIAIVAHGFSAVDRSPIEFTVPEEVRSATQRVYTVGIFLGTHETIQDLRGLKHIASMPFMC